MLLENKTLIRLYIEELTNPLSFCFTAMKKVLDTMNKVQSRNEERSLNGVVEWLMGIILLFLYR